MVIGQASWIYFNFHFIQQAGACFCSCILNFSMFLCDALRYYDEQSEVQLLSKHSFLLQAFFEFFSFYWCKNRGFTIYSIANLQLYNVVEWFLKKKMGTRQVVQKFFWTPIPKSHILTLLLNLAQGLWKFWLLP